MVSKIIKIGAPWCGPCRALKTELTSFDTVPIIELDAEDDEKEVDKYKVKSLPTLIFLNENDEEISRHVGMITKVSLTKKINDLNGL